MSGAALRRTNLLLEVGKSDGFARLYSHAAILKRCDELSTRLAVETGLAALRALRKLGGPADVLSRAPARKR